MKAATSAVSIFIVYFPGLSLISLLAGEARLVYVVLLWRESGGSW